MVVCTPPRRSVSFRSTSPWLTVVISISSSLSSIRLPRVLCRLDQVTADTSDKKIHDQLWQCAAEILPRKSVGDFNSALMELGALICTPKLPDCENCPVRKHCQANSAGIQNDIPVKKKAVRTPEEFRLVLCIENAGRYLIEQRPATGRWATMWQFATVPVESIKPRVAAEIAKSCTQSFGIKTTRQKQIGEFQHILTHRRYTFQIFHAIAISPLPKLATNRRWVRLAELDHYPLPRPHSKIAELLKHVPD